MGFTCIPQSLANTDKHLQATGEHLQTFANICRRLLIFAKPFALVFPSGLHVQGHSTMCPCCHTGYAFPEPAEAWASPPGDHYRHLQTFTSIGKHLQAFANIYIRLANICKHLHPFTSIYIHFEGAGNRCENKPFANICSHLHPFTSIYIHLQNTGKRLADICRHLQTFATTREHLHGSRNHWQTLTNICKQPVNICKHLQTFAGDC